MRPEHEASVDRPGRPTPDKDPGSCLGLGLASALAAMCTVLLSSVPALGQAPTAEPRSTAARTSRVSATLPVQTSGGAVLKLLVSVDDWSIGTGSTEMDMPDTGTVIMTVGAGSVSAVVGGVAKTYRTGDYWTVPAGAHVTLSIKAPARGASVRTIVAVPAS